MKKVLLIVAGTVCLVLGGVGIVIPILPTTPFVIVAAICFSASSPKVYNKLLKMKFFGEYIENYKSKTGISTKTRLASIAFLWAVLGLSAIFVTKTYVYFILGAVGIGVTVHLLTIRRKKPVEKSELIALEKHSADKKGISTITAIPKEEAATE